MNGDVVPMPTCLFGELTKSVPFPKLEFPPNVDVSKLAESPPVTVSCVAKTVVPENVEPVIFALAISEPLKFPRSILS